MKKQSKSAKKGVAQLPKLNLSNTKMAVVIALIFGLAGGYVLSSTYAASGRVTSNAACSVSPNPVSQYSDYTVAVTGLDPGIIINVLVTDSASTGAWSASADANGNASITGHAYWLGDSTAKVQTYKHRKWVPLAYCSFHVN
jgi:hypothetical protein